MRVLKAYTKKQYLCDIWGRYALGVIACCFAMLINLVVGGIAFAALTLWLALALKLNKY